MKIRIALGIAFIALGCPHSRGDALEQSKPGEHELSGWGKMVDPDGDCKFFTASGELLIAVPGSGGPHDLAPEINRANAPRVTRTVTGDFTIEVCIDGRFAPGDESTQPGRTGYTGGGVVAIFDDRNVVTLARAVLHRSGGAAIGYANFEIRVDGELLRIGTTEDHPLSLDGPVFLRLQRRGPQFLAAVSADGTAWEELTPKEVPSSWPEKLEAGVIAISTSKEEFDPRFSKLKVSP